MGGPAPRFGDIYREHHAGLVRLAYVLTGSAEDAQDLVHDAFAELHRRWDRVDQPVPYLRRCVVNATHTWHRRRYRNRRLPVPPDEPAGLGADHLGDVLDALPRRQREAIVLRFYSDLSEAEIAEALGCRPGTVGSLIHRGLARLRAQLETVNPSITDPTKEPSHDR